MTFLYTSCFKCVDGKNNIVKNGKTKADKQRYVCRNCHKIQVAVYTYQAYNPEINNKIILLTKEGLGIRSTSRILQISTTTLLKRITGIASEIRQPIISKGKIYEVDEIRSYIKRKDKLIWIVYALDRETKNIVSFNVGSRTNKTLNLVLKTLKFSDAKEIHTDGLKNYKYLIPDKVHKVIRHATNHIERSNLTLRTHLKRLNRRTICFTRSLAVLNAILKIYFWSC